MPEIIVFEVTNRCNLNCMHCNKIINEAPIVDISLSLVDKVLTEAQPFNPRVVALSGGEPTTHKQFDQLLGIIESHDLGYTLTTNGQNFRESHKALLRHYQRLKGVTFSVEGATAEVNDPVRGNRTFERLLDAFELCRRHGIAFGMQMVVGTRNSHQIEEFAALAEAQGADDANFILMRPTPRAIEEGLLLDLEAAEEVEQKVAELRKAHQRLKVSMTTGYYSPWVIYACRPLSMTVIGIDYNGYLRVCPDVSNYRGAHGLEDVTDVVADLNMRTLQWSLKALANRIALFWQNKIDWACQNDLAATDYYPCYYCLRYFNKADCLEI